MILTIIDISVNMIKLSSTVSNVVPPISLILGSIRPYLNTVSMSYGASDLALEHGTVVEDYLILELKAWLVQEQVYILVQWQKGLPSKSWPVLIFLRT